MSVIKVISKFLIRLSSDETIYSTLSQIKGSPLAKSLSTAKAFFSNGIDSFKNPDIVTNPLVTFTNELGKNLVTIFQTVRKSIANIGDENIKVEIADILQLKELKSYAVNQIENGEL